MIQKTFKDPLSKGRIPNEVYNCLYSESLLNIAAEAAKGREQSCIAFLASSQSQQIRPSFTMLPRTRTHSDWKEKTLVHSIVILGTKFLIKKSLSICNLEATSWNRVKLVSRHSRICQRNLKYTKDPLRNFQYLPRSPRIPQDLAGSLKIFYDLLGYLPGSPGFPESPGSPRIPDDL